MKLKRLFTEVDPASAAALEDIQLARTHSYAQRDSPQPTVESSRKRFSNIIIVDLIKENKKLKLPERPQPVRLLHYYFPRFESYYV